MVAMRDVTTELPAIVGGWAIRSAKATLLVLLPIADLSAQWGEGTVVDTAGATLAEAEQL